MVVSSTTISWANAITISAKARLRDLDIVVDSICWLSGGPNSGRLRGGRRPAGGRLPHAQVLGDADQPELEQLVAREGRCGFCVIDDLRLDQRVVVALVGDEAPPRCLDVEIPGGLLTERAGHDEAVAERTHAEWCGVHSPGLAAAMAEDPDDRHPPSPSDQQRQWIDEPREETDDAASARTQIDAPSWLVHCITSRTSLVISGLAWLSCSLMTQRRAATSGS